MIFWHENGAWREEFCKQGICRNILKQITWQEEDLLCMIWVQPSVHSVIQHNYSSQYSITGVFQDSWQEILPSTPSSLLRCVLPQTWLYSKWQLVQQLQCAGVLMPGPHMNNGNPVQWPSCSCWAPAKPKPNSRPLTLCTDNTLCHHPATQERSQSQLTTACGDISDPCPSASWPVWPWRSLRQRM